MEGSTAATKPAVAPESSLESDIPSKFAQFSEKIRATAKKSIKINLKKATGLMPWQSKVGGQPYLPLTKEIPTNKDGVPLMFLAQINFSEVPRMPDYPTKGIVEFYIDHTDSLMGMDMDFELTEQSGFRVLYFDTIETHDLEHHKYPIEEIPKDSNFGPLTRNDSYSMAEFILVNQYMSAADYRFESTIIPYETDDYELVDEYKEIFPASGHRIGGYPYFTQTDPRDDKDSLKGYELLFQLDDDVGIEWGDGGVGGFFIHPEHLKNCDFSKVAYNWDCC